MAKNDKKFTRLASSLKGLLDTSDPDAPCWHEADYADVLRHQLGAPLADDLGLISNDASRFLAEAKVETFDEALLSPAPHIPLLRLLRDFAKALANLRATFPADVATVLYYATIAAGELAGTKISRLTEKEIRQGYTWALEQAWLTPGLRRLFAKGLA